MKKELSDKLYQNYPRLFSEFKCVECGDGWYGLIDGVCSVIEHCITRLPPDLQSQVHARQIKEKYGTLRFYMSHETPFIEGAIAMAEAMSEITCENCGDPGHERQGGWVLTLCDKCHEEREAKRK